MKSPLAYIGGKSKLAKQIISMIPEHKTYCEVFSGAAWVFFKKPSSKVEVINDLITFYRVVQNHLEEFLKQFKWLLTSREWFQDWKDQLEVRGLTDIQKAARYYYVQRLAFGGKVKGRTYGVQIDRTVPRINLLRLEEEMSMVHLRLAHVRIENLKWQELIKRYDRPDTFFYCDPPYHGHPDYKHNMILDDYIKMADILSRIKGKFILSINDNSDMRSVFKNFKIQPISLLYSVGKKPTKAKELIIKNL
ncbi:DNA adenine methylase [Desulfobacula phenolica]|uniref:site-specific DNA-methyltransferase (adenine-specific) n=1 Tax=Desulfobacula phenolica TaxID=90732 RepID=A0A1H2H3S1_9BACT|nr:DNA adenine methylase [Desulfobacula phenolica]SDU26482.1 DNA adenine methylase [Desulfobacula phenolica]